jgi:hypothetical protein
MSEFLKTHFVTNTNLEPRGGVPSGAPRGRPAGSTRRLGNPLVPNLGSAASDPSRGLSREAELPGPRGHPACPSRASDCPGIGLFIKGRRCHC